MDSKSKFKQTNIMKRFIIMLVVTLPSFYAFSQEEEDTRFKYAPDPNELALKQRIRSFDRDFTEDDCIAAPGKISKATAWNIHQQATLALEDLAKIPDGENGKSLPDHALLKQMGLDLDAVATSMNRNEFFQLIPRLLALDSMDKEYAQVLCVAKRWISGDVLKGTIAEIAGDEIKEKQGNVDASFLEKMTLVYCNVRFHPSEEFVFELPETVDARSIFILDPVKVTQILKTRNHQEVTYFLSNENFDSVFKPYDVGGGGLAVLKAKFAANKALIKQKYEEMHAYKKQLEAQNPKE